MLTCVARFLSTASSRCASPRCSCILWRPTVARRWVEHLGLPAERVFSWNAPFEGMAELCDAADVEACRHAIVELPPRTDFFAKHESQFK